MLNAEEFKSLIIPLSKIMKFAPNLEDKATIKAYYLALREFEKGDLEKACILASRTLNEFPTIKQLFELCEGNVLTAEQVGQKIATDIEYFVGLFGPNALDPKNHYREELTERLGEVGMKVAEICGGWKNLCWAANEDMPSMRKKIRDAGTNIYKQWQAFGEEKPLSLPKGLSTERAPMLENALKLIR